MASSVPWNASTRHAPPGRAIAPAIPALVVVLALVAAACGSGPAGGESVENRAVGSPTAPAVTTPPTATLSASTEGTLVASTATAAGPTSSADGTAPTEPTATGQADPGPDEAEPTTTAGPTTTAAAPIIGRSATGAARVAPAWLGRRPLPTTPQGDVVVPQTTPADLVDRRLLTVDLLDPPPGSAFESTSGPVPPEVLARSTWEEGCPVDAGDLAYLTVSFWGFDGRPHTGELIVNRVVAADLIGVFERLHEARFPIEEMRVDTRADLDAPPTGDGNNTSAFVCRAVTGGSSFSQHAYGLAIDINPFHNPYRRGDLVLPELAGAYLDRSRERPGMIVDGDVVVDAFTAIGWGWGGDWDSLEDYQHFSRNGR